MVGKTFKGLTDAMLEWQTKELAAREIGRDGITVFVRPELVVEIALDGVQVSKRYAGGVALPVRAGPPLPRRQDPRCRRPDRSGPGAPSRARAVGWVSRAATEGVR